MKRNNLHRIFSGFQAFCCILPLFLVVGAQNPISNYTDSTNGFLPEVENNYSLSYELGNDYDYIISTDGSDISVEKSCQIVYGGPNDEGGVDGADASSVFNAAIAMLEGSGGKIKVLQGCYLINSKIVFCSNLELHCIEGALFNLSYNGVMFEFSGVSNSAIRGAEIYGNRDNFSGTPIVINENRGVGSSYIAITNNCIFYSSIRGISVEGALSINNNVSCNIVEDTLQEGIMISFSSNNTINDNLVEKTGLHGIVSTGGNYNTISGNTIKDVGGNYVSGFAHGIAVDGNEGLNVCYCNVVSNNSILSVVMAGIEVADGAHNTTIANNYVANTSTYGIYFGGYFAPSSNGVISGNTLYNCGLNGDQGILVSGASADNPTSNVIVIGNKVDLAGKDGIHLKWVNKSKVTENTCHGCAGYGLFLDQSNSKSITVTNSNRFDFNVQGKIYQKN
jgi:parallel beta-helix repeat protein